MTHPVAGTNPVWRTTTYDPTNRRLAQMAPSNQKRQLIPMPSPSATRRARFEELEDRRMLATFSVTNTDDSGAGSLRQAILDSNNASGADTIEFNAGVFASAQTINLQSALPTITDDLTIAGPGAELLTLNAGNGSDTLPGTGDGFRLLDIDDSVPGNLLDVSASGLTLTGGDVDGSGGAIQTSENLTLIDSVVTGNATGPGTDGANGLPGQDGQDGGRGGDGGGIFSNGGTLTVIGSVISNNSTGRGGHGGDGGDGANGPNGEDGGEGGNGGNAGYGGGIFTDTFVGNLIITNSTISGNSTGAGGLAGRGGEGGEADFGGISGSGADGGEGGYGGNGGGIYSGVGEITITNSTISGNSTGAGSAGGAGGDGGFGAPGGDGGDGGIGGSGGGLYSVEGRMELSMSTVTGNQAAVGGAGGMSGFGAFAGSDGTDGNGGGIDSLGNNPFLIDNTIIAGNLAPGSSPDLRTGSVTLDIEFSLIGDGDGLTINTNVGNQIGTALQPIDPRLAPLASNGGGTPTHAPLPDSPVIDAGDPAILFNAAEFDQRNSPFVRVEDGDFVAGSIIDIGAYEAQAPPTADFDQDGDVDGTDFLTWQRGFGTSSGALLAEGNSDDDGDVDVSDLAVWTATYGQAAAPLQAQSASSPSDTNTTSSDLADLAALSFVTSVTTESEAASVAVLTDTGYDSAFAQLDDRRTPTSNSESAAPTQPTDDDAASDPIDTELRDEFFDSLS